GLMKVVASRIRGDGLWAIFTHPVLYLVCVVGPLGFLLSQQTFKHGVLVAPAIAVMSIVDPLVSIAIGVAWLGESVVFTPQALAGQAAGLALLVIGLAL